MQITEHVPTKMASCIPTCNTVCCTLYQGYYCTMSGQVTPTSVAELCKYPVAPYSKSFILSMAIENVKSTSRHLGVAILGGKLPMLLCILYVFATRNICLTFG